MVSTLARRARSFAVAGLMVGCAFAATPAAARGASAPGVSQLSGVLHLTAGSCSGGRPTGSYLSVKSGSKPVTNSASDCEGGAVTLLAPGSDGLSTERFSPSSDLAFDLHGNAVASTIARPVTFGHHVLGLVSATQDLQDAPTAGRLFSLPRVYVTGDKVLADVRSVQVLYNGAAGTTCATASGAGCWLIGAERATGTYDARSHRLSLSWFSGQSFVPQSASTSVHLSGIFVGAPKRLHHGTVVELGTSSFPAGSAPTVTTTPSGPRHPGHVVATGRRDQAGTGLADPHDSPVTQIVRSPAAVITAALLVGVDALLFAAVLGRRPT